MSGDVYHKPSSGDPFSPSARQWGTFVDAAASIREGRRAGALGGTKTLSPGVIMIRHSVEDETLPEGSILTLIGPAVQPADNLAIALSARLFSGEPPQEGDEGRFVVTLAPIPYGSFGPACAVGAAFAKVGDGDADFADISPGNTDHLIRTDTGGARILWVGSEIIDEPDRYWALVAVGGGGGSEECECECVHELAIANSPSGGSVGLTYTIDGTTGSAVTVNYNHSATTIRDAIVAGNSSKLTNDNCRVYGGPLPMVSVYIRFTADLSGLFIPVPSVSNALTGTNVSPKYGIFQTPGWA